MRTSTIKSLAALALTGVGSALVVGFKTPDAPVAVVGGTPGSTTTSGSSAGTVAPAPSTGSGSSSGSSASATPTASSAPVSAPSASSTTGYANGTWTGTAVREPWGSFQVQAVISGGKLTDVILVSSPSDGHSDRINSQAVPILTQSALAAQSAQIDMVSGATWTSNSYTTSLQAALDQATAAAQKAG